MNLTKIGIILVLLLMTNTVFCQVYNIELDTTNITTTSFKPHIIIDDSPDDSLKYEIKIYSYENQDTNLVYLDTFYYHNPKVLSFDYMNFRYQNDQTYLTMTELNIFPFLVIVKILTKTGVLVEELIFDDYE